MPKTPAQLIVYVKNILTLGPLGYLPKAPGTVGSLAALILGLLLRGGSHDFMVMATLLALGVGSAGIWYYYTHHKPSSDDPSYIIIDEVFGMWLVMAHTPFTPLSMFLAFVFFRVFDILKPFPIRLIENFFKGTPTYNAIGIMFDDALAAIYAILVVNILYILGIG